MSWSCINDYWVSPGPLKPHGCVAGGRLRGSLVLVALGFSATISYLTIVLCMLQVASVPCHSAIWDFELQSGHASGFAGRWSLCRACLWRVWKVPIWLCRHCTVILLSHEPLTRGRSVRLRPHWVPSLWGRKGLARARCSGRASPPQLSSPGTALVFSTQVLGSERYQLRHAVRGGVTIRQPPWALRAVGAQLEGRRARVGGGRWSLHCSLACLGPGIWDSLFCLRGPDVQLSAESLLPTRQLIL